MPNYVPEYGVKLVLRQGDGKLACPDCYRAVRETNTGFICDRCNAVYDPVEGECEKS